MKKIIIIVLGIGLIVGLSIMAINLKSSSKATDVSLIAFAIEDTAKVDKIEIYDSYMDMGYTLTRNKEGVWVGPNQECIQQSIPKMMLETFNKITLRGYVAKGAMKNMKRLLMSQHKEVKIYQNGKWVKTWYVGHSTHDHMGTYMLLKTPKMHSDNPVIMGMKGFYGILGPRFFADARKFECTDLFSFKRSEIKSVEVINRVKPEDSYKLIVNNGNYDVSSNGQPIHNINKDNLTFYLNGFENIHFNQPNYTLTEHQIDSIKAAVPDYELDIKGSVDAYHLKLYRRPDPDENQKDTLIYDDNYLWGVKADGELVRMQFYSVGPLIEGKTIFVEY